MKYLILIAVSFFLHPFHVSVTDIKFKEGKKVLQISSRIFADDLEKALKEENQLERYDILKEKDTPKTKKWIESYMLKNLKLSIKGKPLEVRFVGFEFEEEVIWCYLEVEKVRNVKSLTVENKLLIDTYADQENLVHLRAYDNVRSERMSKKNTVETLTFD